jgi:hypothetical protein
MILPYGHLTRHPAVFLRLTGWRVTAVAALAAEVRPRHMARERDRWQRPGRHRALGAGHPRALVAAAGGTWPPCWPPPSPWRG